jgi:hypothetical protein
MSLPLTVFRSIPLVAGCLLALSGCGDSNIFEEQNDGQSVTFDVGEPFEVHLTVDSEAGHAWKIESVKESVVKSVESTVGEGEEEGEDATVVFTFECAGAGETRLLLVESDERGTLSDTFELDVTCEAEEAETEETEETKEES